MVPGLRLAYENRTPLCITSAWASCSPNLKAWAPTMLNRGRRPDHARALQGMLQAYERWRCDDQLPASYEVFLAGGDKNMI